MNAIDSVYSQVADNYYKSRCLHFKFSKTNKRYFSNIHPENKKERKSRLKLGIITYIPMYPENYINRSHCSLM